MYLKQRPEELEKLVEIAKVQSTEASNAIEGIVTTNTRIRQLVEEKTKPKNRDEQEIAGYRDVLGIIHESFDAIPITQSYILQLHKVLYRYMNNPVAGRTKTVQNYISATYPDGHTETLFTPPAPYETPDALDRLCAEYNRVIGNLELEPLIVDHWVPTGAAPGDKKHGTNVAGKVAFENLGEQLASGVLTPRARIIDCNIRGLDPDSKKPDRPDLICNSTMIARIKEAVLRYKDITKIFNFSSSEETPIQGDEISILGYELDVLAIQYGVKFTISTGNHYLYRNQDSLEDILQDDNNRIAAPADSMLNIAVGAIVGAEHKEGLSRQYEVAPYSRIGPGFRGFRKPDIVSLAGTMTKADFVPPDEYAMMIASGGQWAFEAGTSFTAPTVAGDLAEISQSVPDQDILMSETLLYHGAEMPISEVTKKKITRDDNAFYGNLYGRGIANPLVSMFSTAHRVTFLHRGTMKKKHKQHAKFLMPGVCNTKFDMSKRDKKIKVTVTCVTQPPVDKTKGAEYLGAYVNVSLHSRNGNDKLVTNNPSESDGRKDWDTCFHFEQEFSSFHGGDWEVWLELHTRYDVEDDQEIDYALAITIEDLTESLQLYEAIVNEAQNRFPAVQLVRLPVRT